MKTIVLIFVLIGSLSVFSCKNNDTATQMPNGGYQERTDTGNTMPTMPDSKDRGAVAVDTIKNGQVTVTGSSGTGTSPADSSKK